MRVERAVEFKTKESLSRATPAKSGIHIPVAYMPEDRVLKTIVRMDKCTRVDC